MLISDEEVSQLLKENGLVEDKDLISAQQFAKDSKITLYDALLSKELITDDQLGKLVADSKNLKFADLSQINITDDVIRIIPEVVARNQKAVAFARDANGIKIATTNPENMEFINLISKKTGDKVIPYLTTEQNIENVLVQYQKELQNTFDKLLSDNIKQAKLGTKGDAPISKIVDLLIEYANDNKASDIHIEPHEKESLIRFRIDGVLHDVLKLPKNLHEQIIARIKVLARLRTDEHLTAQDGKMQLQITNENLDVRVSVVPVSDGEKVVLRLLAEHARRFALNELGVSQVDIVRITKGVKKPFGMVLATGPTGSGKTTTIYSILKILNSREKNIATIEDPVEYDVEGINQIQVNVKAKLTFANGLRSIVRQDPDIIFVGEIRDKETAGIAINSAMTGHLVLSTLHTNDAATTLPRLIDMNIEPFLVASTVNVIIAQRLIRKICQSCRVSKSTAIADFAKLISADILEKHFPKISSQSTAHVTTYNGKGCDVCHKSGYSGRIGLFEIMEISSEIKDLITKKSNADLIKKTAVAQGMSTLLDDGLAKVKTGITTLEEVLRATKT